MPHPIGTYPTPVYIKVNGTEYQIGEYLLDVHAGEPTNVDGQTVVPFTIGDELS